VPFLHREARDARLTCWLQDKLALRVTADGQNRQKAASRKSIVTPEAQPCGCPSLLRTVDFDGKLSPTKAVIFLASASFERFCHKAPHRPEAAERAASQFHSRATSKRQLKGQ
jgi:hypothetical protein